jgi:RNA recognition motif-containing protein
MTPEECRQIYSEFGEVRAAVTNHIHDRGLAFITYYDIRHAKAAIEQMQNYHNRGRNPVTGYAYHVPTASGLDRRDLALTVLLRPVQVGVRVDPEAVQQVMSEFGEVEAMAELPNGNWVIDYFDTRAVEKVKGQVDGIVIGGQNFLGEVILDREVLFQSQQAYGGQSQQTYTGQPQQTSAGQPKQTYAGQPQQTYAGQPQQTYAGQPQQTSAGTGQSSTELMQSLLKLQATLLPK